MQVAFKFFWKIIDCDLVERLREIKTTLYTMYLNCQHQRQQFRGKCVAILANSCHCFFFLEASFLFSFSIFIENIFPSVLVHHTHNFDRYQNHIFKTANSFFWLHTKCFIFSSFFCIKITLTACVAIVGYANLKKKEKKKKNVFSGSSTFSPFSATHFKTHDIRKEYIFISEQSFCLLLEAKFWRIRI